MKRFALTGMLLLLSACPKKATTDAPAASAGEAQVATKVPGDANSKKFAARLIDLAITDWSPEDTGQVDFIYTDFSYNSNNTWLAHGRVTIIDESVDCQESGRWTMDPAENEWTAFVVWTLEKTTCPGRESNREMRMKVTISKDGGFEVKLH